jgi:hypothetical protein
VELPNCVVLQAGTYSLVPKIATLRAIAHSKIGFQAANRAVREAEA